MIDSRMQEKPSHILVVDDDNVVLSTVGEMMELRGLQVMKLSTAREALKQIAAHTFDVIVSDINMPDMTGLDLVKRIRSFNTDIAIILMTGFVESYSIQDAILSAKRNDPAEVIVIEGGSTDRTFELASRFADRALQVTPFNLGHKRNVGVNVASQRYVLNMDADQVLEPEGLETMIRELEHFGWAGIQTQLKSVRNDTYWEAAMEATLQLSHGSPGPRTMLGTPALYQREVLLENGFNSAITGSCDDTDLCYRLTRRGYSLGVSTATCYQKHRASLRGVLKKFYWYGQGDHQFGRLHPERRWSIFLHPIRNYMFGKTLALIRQRKLRYAAFPLLAGLARHLGFWKGWLNFLRDRQKLMAQASAR